MRDYNVSSWHNTHSSSLLKVSKREVTAGTEEINAAHILQELLLLWTMHCHLPNVLLSISEFMQFPGQTVYMRVVAVLFVCWVF